MQKNIISVKKFFILLVVSQMLFINVFAGSKYFYSIDVNKTVEENLANLTGNEAVKAKVAEYGRYTLDYYFNYEGVKELQPLVDSFQPKGQSDYSKLLDVVKYFRQLNLKYGPRTEEGTTHQVLNIHKGYTQCFGAAIFAGKLLDKSNIEYRYVLSRYRDRRNLLKDTTDGGHIYLEVKTDAGNWMEFDPTEIISYGRNWNYNKRIKNQINVANKRGSVEMPDRNYKRNIVKKKSTEYREYVVSPVYKNGGIVDSRLMIFNDL